MPLFVLPLLRWGIVAGSAVAALDSGYKYHIHRTKPVELRQDSDDFVWDSRNTYRRAAVAALTTVACATPFGVADMWARHGMATAILHGVASFVIAEGMFGLPSVLLWLKCTPKRHLPILIVATGATAIVGTGVTSLIAGNFLTRWPMPISHFGIRAPESSIFVYGMGMTSLLYYGYTFQRSANHKAGIGRAVVGLSGAVSSFGLLAFGMFGAEMSPTPHDVGRVLFGIGAVIHQSTITATEPALQKRQVVRVACNVASIIALLVPPGGTPFLVAQYVFLGSWAGHLLTHWDEFRGLPEDPEEHTQQKQGDLADL